MAPGPRSVLVYGTATPIQIYKRHLQVGPHEYTTNQLPLGRQGEGRRARRGSIGQRGGSRISPRPPLPGQTDERGRETKGGSTSGAKAAGAAARRGHRLTAMASGRRDGGGRLPGCGGASPGEGAGCSCLEISGGIDGPGRSCGGRLRGQGLARKTWARGSPARPLALQKGKVNGMLVPGGAAAAPGGHCAARRNAGGGGARRGNREGRAPAWVPVARLACC
jgi:hypothetical protein